MIFAPARTLLDDIQERADAVVERLRARGLDGTLVASLAGASVRVEWMGARRDRLEAERALIAALGEYDAESMPGLGVFVSERPVDALDHEAAVHNQEPDESTLRECELYEGMSAAAE